MGRTVIGLLIGIILGGVLTFFLFVGVPRAGEAPGTPIAPPDPAAGPPAGTAQVVLHQEFFNEVLETVFRDMNAPAFPLTLTGQPGDPNAACKSEITLLPEGSGVKTAVRFDNERLAAPLAFRGSYSSMFGCLQFTGWAQAHMQLRFDPAQQSVFGHLNVETVNLDGVNPVISGIITPLVQSSLNSRVNPITIMDGRQITVNVPVAATGSSLRAAVNDVRAEIKQNALHLFVVYDFRGVPSTEPAPVPPQ